MIGVGVLALIGTAALVLVSLVILIMKQYKVCPPAKMLVVYGRKSGKDTASKIIHGGGVFVVPFFQQYGVLDLRPRTAEVKLSGALSLNNIRVDVPTNLTYRISEKAERAQNAAMCLLDVSAANIQSQIREIAIGQMRSVIASMSIEDINTDREQFMGKVEEEIQTELDKIGIEIVNVNIEDIKDQSGYIDAIGKKAAASAIQQANIDTAVEVKKGAIGVAEAKQGQNISVAEAQSKEAQGTTQATADQRTKVMSIEATTVASENESKTLIVETNANLAVKVASASRQAKVAEAEAQEAVLNAEKATEVARLRTEEVAQIEINKEKQILQAQAEAEAILTIARGEADATLLKAEAEAKGVRAVLEGRAEGYKKLFESAENEQSVINIIMAEQLPEIQKLQAEALKNLKIDKVTILDSNQGATTGDFIGNMVSTLPAAHETASAAGLVLPTIMGKIEEDAQKAMKDSSTAEQA